MKDKVFAKSREVLSARKRDLVVYKAKGNRPQAPLELTEEVEGFLFHSGQFGENDPQNSSAHRVEGPVLTFRFQSPR